ncbi:MAG: transposase [Rhodospirillaceae bacterium]|nr:transposase [Rhodospirillaceae bacterium]
MVRPLRALVAGVPVHVIQRGHNRGQIFFGAEDAQKYLGWLEELAAQHGVAIHAYVLMTNHLHLLATPKTAAALPKTLQRVGTRYAMYLNGARDRSGSLWEGRYRACPVESERYLLACSRYIEQNPVRAGLAKHPREFRWSSFRGNAGERADPLLSPHPVYRALGSSDAERARAYRALHDDAPAPGLLETIRTAVNAGTPLGDAGFVAQMGRALGRSFAPKRRGRPPKPRLVPGKLQKNTARAKSAAGKRRKTR